MFTFMQKAIGYISGSGIESEPPAGKYDRPKLEDFISVSCFEKKEFKGKVTSISDTDIVVDNDIYFSVPIYDLKCKFKVGSDVQGYAERQSKYEAWKAVNLCLCPVDEEKWEDSNPKLTGDTISSRDLDAGIPGILKNDLFPSCGSKVVQLEKLPLKPYKKDNEIQKTIMGKAKHILGDTVTMNETTYFKLSDVESSFDIQQGDWILCKLNANQPSDLQRESSPQRFLRVTHVEPLRQKRIKGEVTRIYGKHIIINNEVFCSKSIAKNIGELRVGDAVITEVIESDRNHFGWRSISIIPDVFPVMKVLKIGAASSLNGFNWKATSELFNDKHDIIISNSLRFSQVYLGCKTHITVYIKNVGEQVSTLLNVLFINAIQDSQFSLVSDSLKETQSFTPITIFPHESCSVKIACTGKFLGQCKKVCVFDFGTFKIGRHLIATVEDQQMHCIGPTVPYCPRERQKPSYPYPSDAKIVRGEKPFRAPAFIPTSLPQYHIPNELWTTLLNEEKICNFAPILKEEVNAENYQDRFSLLLFLEEIEMTLQMRKFDIERTTFFPHGEFLSLSVPGLAEKRPSLMIGDSIIASNPADIRGPEYEGFIHDVLHTKVLLKFHPAFHEQCQDKDFSVRFNFNRTPLRRCHYALKFCMDQHGSEVLFPKKLKYRLPQVAYVDKELFQYNFIKKAGPIAKFGKKSCQEISNHGITVKSSMESSVVCLNARDMVGSRKTEKCVENGNFPADVAVPQLLSVKTSNNISTKVKENSLLNDKECDLDESYVGINKSTDSYMAEISTHSVMSDKCNENSPTIVKGAGKANNFITPPRVPVVTRLFGVPSSGSSTNSSICCSDDEVRSNAASENDIIFRKNIRKRTTLDHVEKSVDKSKAKILFGESSNSPPDLEVSASISSCCAMRTGCSKSDCHKENGLKLPIFNQALQSETSGADKFSESCRSFETIDNKVGVSENIKIKKNRLCSQDVVDNNKQTGMYYDSILEKPPTSVVSFEELLKESSKKKYDYCVPVLPARPSASDKIKNGKVPVLEWFNKKLNSEQKMAVRRILEGSTRPLPYVIYGPPGTGKTMTLVEAVLQTFTLVDHSRILIVAPSNSAADLVTERLLKFDVVKKADLVRLNAYQRREETIPERIFPYCYNGDQLSSRVWQRVIITTATTAGLMYRLGLHNGHFTHVFVDEAGQLTEPECLVALGLVNSASGQIVLAGDPQQLGPVVLSRLAKSYGLQDSLLHRMCNSVLYQPEEKSNNSTWTYEPRLVTQLLKNYRSHPDIINVSSKLFYHDSLVACADAEIREKLLSWSELPSPSCPVLFHGVVSDNLQEGDSPSWFNPTETFQVVRYAKSLANFGLSSSDIGIITPYRKQVEKIRQLLTIFGVQPGIKVGTVEEFQGQERTAIIISTVRSSEELLEVDMEHSLGFVKCRRRFNVAITRAQSLLIVVGNPLLLSLDNCWLSFISFCISKNAYIGAEIDLDNLKFNGFD